MKVKQISVFLENKSGRLAEVAKLLGEAGINIRALSIADTSDFGILRLIVNAPEQASQVLKAANFTLSETEIIVVQVPDHPGGLAKILEVMESSQVNIEYMYAFVGHTITGAVVVFRVEQLDLAIQILAKAGIKLLSETEVYA